MTRSPLDRLKDRPVNLSSLSLTIFLPLSYLRKKRRLWQQTPKFLRTDLFLQFSFFSTSHITGRQKKKVII